MTSSMPSDHSKSQPFIEAVEEYANQTLAPIARHYDETDEFPHEEMRYFFQNGYFSLLTSNSAEDLSAFFETIRIVSKKFAALASILLTQGFYAVTPIAQFGTEGQKKKYLTGLVNGELYGGFGLTEENERGDSFYIHTTATETENGWVIDGVKKYISNAPIADLLFITAKCKQSDGTEELGIFLIDSKANGVKISEPMAKMGIKSLPVASVTLENVRVSRDSLLGDTLNGSAQVEFTMNLMKLSVAMQAVGISQGTFEKGLDYMSLVRKFGNRLIDNQSTQQKMADIKTSIYSSEAFVRMVIKEDTQNSIEVAMAKLLTANVAVEATESIIQLTGGYGYMKDSEIERYTRDAKVTAIYGGSSDSQRRMITKPWLEGQKEY
ncbi:acyl-CoA dehydrogenase family protein [Jeotgalibaca sp. A127]|uniref:acyl-CoA dehydrogenase family protein n=1 Tax=Jeotgalibaca sp. A127 TaxID=3457324 RepID=UPI003FCF329D